MKSAQDFFREGNRVYALGEFKSALDNYKRAIELNPWFSAAYNNQGNAQRELNQYKAAVISYGLGIELDAKDPELRLNRANASLRLSQFEEALADFRFLIPLLSSLHGVGSVQVSTIQQKIIKIQQLCFAEANRFYAAGKMEKAIACYQQALDLEDKQSLVYNNKGNAHANLRQWDLAHDNYSQAIQYSAQDPDIYCNRAGVCVALSNWQQALDDWEMAAKLYAQQQGPDYSQKKRLTAKISAAKLKLGKSEKPKISPAQIVAQLQSLNSEQLSAVHKILERLLTVTGQSEKEAFYARVHAWKEQKHSQPEDVTALYALVNNLLQQLSALQLQVGSMAEEMDHTLEAKEQLRQINEHPDKNLRAYYHMLRSRLVFSVSGAFAIASLQIKIADTKKGLLIDGLSAVGDYIPVAGPLVKFLADLTAFPLKIYDSITEHRAQSRIARLFGTPQVAQWLIDRLSRLATLQQQEIILKPTSPVVNGLMKTAEYLYSAAQNALADKHKKVMNAYDSLNPAEKLANYHATAILDYIRESHVNHLFIDVDLDEDVRRKQIIESLLKCLLDLAAQPVKDRVKTAPAPSAVYVTKTEFEDLKQTVRQLSDQKDRTGDSCFGDEELQVFTSAALPSDSQNPQRLWQAADRRRSLQVVDIAKEVAAHGGKIDEMDSQIRQLQEELHRLKPSQFNCFIL